MGSSGSSALKLINIGELSKGKSHTSVESKSLFKLEGSKENIAPNLNKGIGSGGSVMVSSDKLITLDSDLKGKEKILLKKISKLPETGAPFLISFPKKDSIVIEVGNFKAELNKGDSLFNTFGELDKLLKGVDLKKSPVVFNNSNLERIVNEYREVQKNSPLSGMNVVSMENDFKVEFNNFNISRENRDLNINVLSTKDFLRSGKRANFNKAEGEIFNRISNEISSSKIPVINISKNSKGLQLESGGKQLFQGSAEQLPLFNQFVTDTFSINQSSISIKNFTSSQKEVVGIINRMNFLKSKPEVMEFDIKKRVKGSGYTVSLTPVKLVERIKEIIKKNPDLLESGVLTRIHSFRDELYVINNFAKDSRYKENFITQLKVPIGDDPKNRKYEIQIDSSTFSGNSKRLGKDGLIKSSNIKEFVKDPVKHETLSVEKSGDQRKIIGVDRLKDLKVSNSEESEEG